MNPPMNPQPRNIPGGVPGGPRPGMPMGTGARRNQIIVLGIVVLALVALVRACSGRENHYENIAHDFTNAIAANDYAAAAKFQNAQTATEMTRGRLGHAADVLSPLGKVRHVKEETPNTEPPRVHDFVVTFERGTVHERIQFDPQDRIFRFHFDPPVKT